MEPIWNAAEEELEEVHPEQKQSYIFAETWKLIEGRRRARERGQIEEYPRLHRVIMVKSKQDKQQSNIATLEKVGTLKEKWRGVNTHRKIRA